jgi:hypothetical protein
MGELLIESNISNRSRSTFRFERLPAQGAVVRGDIKGAAAAAAAARLARPAAVCGEDTGRDVSP